METFKGFTRPQYTPVPDQVFDELMPTLSLAELRTLLYIIRRTFGFKKDRDAISLSQLLNGITTRDGRVLDHGTGICKTSLLKALRGLVDRNIITKPKSTAKNGANLATIYSLNFRSQQEAPTPGSKNLPKRVSISEPDSGAKSSPHKKQDHKIQLNKTLAKLVQTFYARLGRSKVSTTKIERGIGILKQLRREGFNASQLEHALSWLVRKYPDTQSLNRLPYVIDQTTAEFLQKNRLVRTPAVKPLPVKTRAEIATSVQERSATARKIYMTLTDSQKLDIISRFPVPIKSTKLKRVVILGYLSRVCKD